MKENPIAELTGYVRNRMKDIDASKKVLNEQLLKLLDDDDAEEYLLVSDEFERLSGAKLELLRILSVIQKLCPKGSDAS